MLASSQLSEPSLSFLTIGCSLPLSNTCASELMRFAVFQSFAVTSYMGKSAVPLLPLILSKMQRHELLVSSHLLCFAKQQICNHQANEICSKAQRAVKHHFFNRFGLSSTQGLSAPSDFFPSSQYQEWKICTKSCKSGGRGCVKIIALVRQSLCDPLRLE